MSELDNAYKKAFIKWVNKESPSLRNSMDNLARQLRLMPTSIRMRY